MFGITFYLKLKWKCHILETKNSAHKNLRIIKTLSHLECSAESTILMHLFES
jgi:hypothetical protein